MQLLPLLILPVCLPGLQEGDIQNPDKIVDGRFYPMQIVAYHQSYFEERTLIYLSNGQPFLIELTVEQYEEKIRQYFEYISKVDKRETALVKPLYKN